MVLLPAVHGSCQGLVLHEAGRPFEGRPLPRLVLPLLHCDAQAAVLQPTHCLQHHMWVSHAR